MSPFIEDTPLSENIRVALVIEAGKLRPVWFEETDKPGRDRIYVKDVTLTYDHYEGAARIINIGVTDGNHSYKLSLNTKTFTWKCTVSESLKYPRRR